MIKVTFGLIDSTIEVDNKIITAENISRFSTPGDILEEKDTVKLATFENDYFLLDGSFIFPSEDIDYNIGYESENLSDSLGAVNEFIDIDFDNFHSSFGSVFRFIELVINFDLFFYKNDILIHSESVINNDLLLLQLDYELVEFDKVRILFKKIEADKRIRMKSVIFGISQVFTDDTLLSLSSSKTTDNLAENIDVGNIEFTFYNTGGFDVKTLSDLPEGLQKDVSIDLYFDDVLFNKYKSTNTNIEQNGKLINVVGSDILYELGENNYNKGVVYSDGISLKDIALKVAEDADIEIIIDDSLNNIFSTGYIPEVPHREAFRLIAEAGMCELKIIDGILNIKRNIIINNLDLTDDDVIENSLYLDNSDGYKGLIVETYTWSKANELSGLAEIRDILLTGEEQTIYIEYSSKPAIFESITVNNCSVVKSIYYSEHAEITIIGLAGNLAWITLIGYIYNYAITKESLGLSVNAKEIKNYLITGEMGKNVLEFQYPKIKGSYQYTFNTKDNLNLGDVINYDDNEIIVESVNIVINSDEKIIEIGGKSIE